MFQLFSTGPYKLDMSQRTMIMGILNVTPDSFFDGGRYQIKEHAVEQASKMAKDGADIIDIGGESTRPGHQSITLDEELERVLPIIEAVHQVVDLPISIDTSKAEVARQAVQAGAVIINDTWGAKKDPLMAKTTVDLQVPIILMHNREQAVYTSLISEIQQDLLESVGLILQAGGSHDQVILDPGIGFAKSYEENLLVMNQLERFVQLGYPVLLGTSRKSMIGKALNLPLEERIEGTAATVSLGIAKGCRIMRVHDVKKMARVSRMMDAMLRIGRIE